MVESIKDQPNATVDELEHGSSTAVHRDLDVSITRNSYWDNRKAIAISCYINMAFFQNGCDQGMVGGFQAMPGFLRVFGYADPSLPGGYGISTKVQQIIGSFTVLFMGVAAAFLGPLIQRIGRRRALQFGCILLWLSVTLMIACSDLGGLYAGRIFLGLSNGIMGMGSYLFLQETAPANIRSLTFCLSQAWVAFGVLIGSIINNATQTRLDRTSYQIPLGILYIVPFFLFVGYFFFPDTPRWLIERGRKEEGIKALRFYRDSCITDLQVEEEFAEIVRAVQVDRDLAGTTSFLTIWQRPYLKRTLTSIGVNCISAALGAPFISQYGVYFFLQSGDTHPFRDGVVMTTVGLAGALLMPILSGRAGKRPIFLVACTLQALCMLGMAVAGTVGGVSPPAGKAIVAFTIIYYFIYTASTAPFAFQVAGEIPSQFLRTHTYGIGGFATFLGGWLLTFSVPYFENPENLNWGAKYGYIWVGSTALTIVFIYFCVPETNKRTLEEIDECYLAGVPARKFPSHQCVGTKQAREEAVLRHKEGTTLGESVREIYMADVAR